MKIEYILKTLLIISLAALSACAGLTEKLTSDKTIAMINSDVDTSTGKVIIFPMMLLSNGDFTAANTEFDNSALSALLVKSWSNELEDGDKYAVPKSAIDKLPKGWEAVEFMVRGMDSANMEARLDSDLMKAFYQGVNKLAGKGILAVSLVFEDEETYKATKALHYNAGLFDMETAKFKWITKTVQKSPSLPGVDPIPYPAMIQQAINESWDVLKEKNNGAVR